jgi:hypothetical protein
MICVNKECRLKGAYVRRNKKTGGKEIYCRMCDTTSPIIDNAKETEGLDNKKA